MDFITDFLRWCIGNGPLGIFSVADLWDSSSGSWNLHMVQALYGVNQVEDIFKIIISHCGLKDKLIWKGNETGDYSVANGYKLLLSNMYPSPSSPISVAYSSFPWKDYWKSKVPFKLLLFGWKIVHQAIPTKSVLRRHHRDINEGCVFCLEQAETIDHIFIHCSFAKAVWYGLPMRFMTNVPYINGISQWIELWLKKWKCDKV